MCAAISHSEMIFFGVQMNGFSVINDDYFSFFQKKTIGRNTDLKNTSLTMKLQF